MKLYTFCYVYDDNGNIDIEGTISSYKIDEEYWINEFPKFYPSLNKANETLSHGINIIFEIEFNEENICNGFNSTISKYQFEGVLLQYFIYEVNSNHIKDITYLYKSIG